MFKYGKSQSDSRPAPELTLYAHSPVDESIVAEVDGLVDTGATMTCVPEQVIEKLGGNLDYTTRRVRYVSGEREERICLVHIRLHRCYFRDVEVIVAGRRFALIGRDILNLHKITLDGVRETWEVEGKC